jgi:hypothetical protein
VISSSFLVPKVIDKPGTFMCIKVELFYKILGSLLQVPSKMRILFQEGLLCGQNHKIFGNVAVLMMEF